MRKAITQRRTNCRARCFRETGLRNDLNSGSASCMISTGGSFFSGWRMVRFLTTILPKSAERRKPPPFEPTHVEKAQPKLTGRDSFSELSEPLSSARTMSPKTIPVPLSPWGAEGRCASSQAEVAPLNRRSPEAVGYCPFAIARPYTSIDGNAAEKALRPVVQLGYLNAHGGSLGTLEWVPLTLISS